MIRMFYPGLMPGFDAVDPNTAQVLAQQIFKKSISLDELYIPETNILFGTVYVEELMPDLIVIFFWLPRAITLVRILSKNGNEISLVILMNLSKISPIMKRASMLNA